MILSSIRSAFAMLLILNAAGISVHVCVQCFMPATLSTMCCWSVITLDLLSRVRL